MAFPYGDVVATTLDAWIEKGVAFDNIFKAHPLLEWLKTHANLEQRGGYQIDVDLEYGTQAGKWISGNDTYSETFSAFIDKGLDSWRSYVVNIQFNFDEKMQNRGEAQIINLIEKKIKNGEKSISEELEEVLFDAQTGSEPNGLLNICTASGTFMGIDRATYPWWKGVVGGLVATPSTLTLPLMANIYNSISGGTELPDFIISPQDLFEKYEALCQTYLQIVNTKVGDAGFQELAYKNAIMRFSGYAETNKMFFLNSEYLYLISAPDGFFYRDEFKRASGKLVWDAPIVWYGNFMCSNCRRQGMLSAKAA